MKHWHIWLQDRKLRQYLQLDHAWGARQGARAWINRYYKTDGAMVKQCLDDHAGPSK